MINYIIQVVLIQVLFLAVYDFFLSKETFFTKNRWYLLCTPILSFLLPLVKIPTFQKAVSQDYIVYLPEIVLSPEKAIQSAIETTTFYQSVNYIHILFWIGVCVFSILFLLKLMKIINFIRKHTIEKNANFTLIFIPNKTKAFSFFNYIFLGKEIPKSQQKEIIAHELVHSKQKHSIDLLFFEFLKIVMWFNPMIYVYQKRITLIHEYISDEVVAKKNTKENYINNLLSSFFEVENISFINQFYKQTFIKKRIIMMTKKQSKKMNQLKYLVLIPMLVSMLFYISCADDAIKSDTVAKKELQTMYRNKDGVLKSQDGNKLTFLDSYIGRDFPLNSKEITIDELSTEEREEFEIVEAKMKNKDSRFEEYFTLKLFKMPNGRNASGMIFNFDKLTENVETKRINSKDDSISFMTIDKKPTFPGCESGDKDCFSSMIQKHFAKNFDAKMVNELGLSSGKKKIFIGFNIDKEGNVVDVKARAPHEDIKQKVISVMSSLPKMIPGENNGKAVAVKYSIPFTIIVE